jgi:hypothetical protein
MYKERKGATSKDSDYDIILKRVSLKLGISQYIISDVVRSVFEYVHNMVGEREYEGFYFKYLGKFIVKPFRLKRVLESQGLIDKEEDV